MKRTKQCPKCSSRRVGYSVTGRHALATLSIGDQDVTSERWLCIDCGYVEVYAIEIEGVDWPAVLDQFYGAIETGPFR